MRLSVKLISLFLFFGLAPLIVVSALLNLQTGEAMRHEAFAKLKNIRQLQQTQVENFFIEKKRDMAVLAESVAAADVLKLAKQTFHDFQKNNQPLGSPEWQSTLDGPLTTWLTQYKTMYDHYDLFLIDNEGNVVFSVEKESDLGENLRHGPLKTSGLARLFSKATHETAIEDYAPYSPSHNTYAAFIGAPIKRNSVALGVIALQFSTQDIDAIMTNRSGLGTSEEFYLVGKIGETSSYRSNRTKKNGSIGRHST